MAAGRQVPRAAYLLRQQDGPHRRGLQGDAQADRNEARGQSGRDPAPHRRRGQVRRRDRPRQDEGDHLQRRDDGRRLRRLGHSGRLDGRGPAVPREADREGQRARRRAAREVSPRPGDHRRRDQEGAARPRDQIRLPRGHGIRRRHLRHRVQEQGRAAAARRGRGLPAVTARRAGNLRPRSEREGRDPRRAARRRRGAVLCAGVQADDRSVRRSAHVHSCLLGHPDVRFVGLQRDEGQDRTRRPPPEDARQQA